MTSAQHDRLIRRLVGDNSIMDWVLRQRPTASSSATAQASCARHHWTCAVDCLMVGMEREALQLLAKSDEWMTAALDRAAAGEVVELEYHRQFDLSVCRWLLGPPASPYDLTRGVNLLHQSEEMVLADLGRNADFLDTALAMLVYAGRYEECIAKFEQERAKTPRTKQQKHDEVMRDYYAGDLPADEAAFLLEDRVEAPMAYLIARERLNPTLPESQLAQLFEGLLRQRVPNWLSYARRDLFTMWVRITTQAVAGAPARAAVRESADQYA